MPSTTTSRAVGSMVRSPTRAMSIERSNTGTTRPSVATVWGAPLPGRSPFVQDNAVEAKSLHRQGLAWRAGAWGDSAKALSPEPGGADDRNEAARGGLGDAEVVGAPCEIEDARDHGSLLRSAWRWTSCAAFNWTLVYASAWVARSKLSSQRLRQMPRMPSSGWPTTRLEKDSKVIGP